MYMCMYHCNNLNLHFDDAGSVSKRLGLGTGSESRVSGESDSNGSVRETDSLGLRVRVAQHES